MTAPDKGTPRVDREVASRMAVNADSEQRLYVTADFARTLERDALRLVGELAEKSKTEAMLAENWTRTEKLLAQVTAERDALQQEVNVLGGTAEAALASREGWQMCPLEPTEEMYAAAEREWDGRMSARIAGVWKAMLAAVKEKPSE